MKVSELTKAKLDYWVGKADNQPVTFSSLGYCLVYVDFLNCLRSYSPSCDWSQGGPIIEREGIELVPGANGEQWSAGIEEFISGGDTPLIAAMRCFVDSKFGEEVSDE